MHSLFSVAVMVFLVFFAMASNQYHTLILEHIHHFDGQEIGSLISLGASTSIFLPWIVLLLGKKIPHPDKILRRSLFFLAICLCLFPRTQNAIAAVFLYYGIVTFMNVASMLQLIVLIFTARPQGDQWVLLIRSGGTLGFAVSCVVSTLIANRLDYSTLYLIFAAAALLAIPFNKKTGPVLLPHTSGSKIRSSWKLLGEKNTRNLLLGVGVAHMAIFGATSVLSNFIANHFEATKSQVSLAWTIATFSEVPLIWLSILILRRFGLKGLLLSGIFTSTIRMGLLFLVKDLSALYGVQVLHGLFYGSTLSGIGLYLARSHGDAQMQQLQMMAQSLYGGVATTIGAQVTGIIWNWAGLRNVYLIAFLTLCGASLWLIFNFREPQEQNTLPVGPSEPPQHPAKGPINESQIQQQFPPL